MGRFSDRQDVRSRQKARAVALAALGAPVPSTGVGFRRRRKLRPLKMKAYVRPRLGGGQHPKPRS